MVDVWVGVETWLFDQSVYRGALVSLVNGFVLFSLFTTMIYIRCHTRDLGERSPVGKGLMVVYVDKA